MLREGYYVEGRYFAGKSAQAIAFAQFRATEFGRPVTVLCKDFSGQVREVGTATPGEAEMQVAA